MTKKSILMVMMGFALLGAPISVNAQVAKNVTKVVKTIGKNVKKKKMTTTTGSKSVQPVRTNCINCSGKGKKNGVKCSSCDGSGKKVRFVRK